MREISSLTLVLSDQCNFSCAYCPQQRGNHALSLEAIQSFLDRLRPFLAEEVWLGFTGGEPLLNWPLVKETVSWTGKNFKNNFHFTLTSNGALLHKAHIAFFKKHHFDLVFSYDGLAQKNRDRGSVAAVETALDHLRGLYPQGYTVNSVFTPGTLPLLAASMGTLLKQGHRRLQYSLDMTVSWRAADRAALEEQLQRLARTCRDELQKTGRMPLENFLEHDQEGIFACFAGRDRLALLPDRTVWGCYMFYVLLGHSRQSSEYAKYCFGKLETFLSGPQAAVKAIEANYAELRQDYFSSEKKELCCLCDDLKSCAVCPVTAAMATGTLAVIPNWTCKLKKIVRRAKASLLANPRRGGALKENRRA